MPNDYDPKEIEAKWQKDWALKKMYEVREDSGKPKWYSLVEFPYPSGEGLHVGHPRPYIGMDIISRKRRMQGYNVLYPIGYDAFGLPAETYAIKTGRKPADITAENIVKFRKQIESLAISFDWSREVNTTDPKYYKWTQWLFLKFLEHDLAYKTKMNINWCPKDKIGLANEEVVDGKCERCGTPVEKREKEQWMLKITAYADRLDKDLDTVDYPERVKSQQRNWIGRSEGAEIEFPLAIKNQEVKPNFLILHGYTGRNDKNFIPWLKSELEDKGYRVQAPLLPNTNNPTEDEQVRFVLEQCSIDENTVIIGHSLGALVAMKAVMRLSKPISGLILVAAVIDPKFDPRDKDDAKGYKQKFSWEINFEEIKAAVKDNIAILSDNQEGFRRDYLKYLAQELNGELQESEACREHFCAAEEPAILKAITPHIKVFTTRPDTIFGATYLVLAPEHAFLKSHTDKIENISEVDAYLKEVKNKEEIERVAEGKEKTGVELKGVMAINPATKEEIPVWIADYVLPHYGTGAIMAVPAHDKRDNEFAKKFNLPIQQVVAPYFEDFTAECHPRNDKNKKVRRAVVALVKHWSEDTYICLQWKQLNWRTLVTGGIEEGESVEDAVRRELLEETGYKNIKSIQEFPERIVSYFFAPHKDLNMQRDGSFVVVELSDGEKVETSQEEQEKHEVVWKKQDETLPFLTFRGEEYDSRDVQYFLGKLFGQSKESVYAGSGVLINSGNFNYRSSEEAMDDIIKLVGGEKKVTFKLRDWVFSRQRYWGEPIPVVHCDTCGIVPVPEKDLPVLLPDVEKYEPTDTGESPLAAITEWVNTTCPACGGPAKRETDTMPNWAGSSWYFLAYCMNQNGFENPASLENWKLQMENFRHWMPIDWYNGGMEHTTLHLLYSRFWNKFFFDIGLVPVSEPYQKRTSHGFILAENGEKMSKSRGNVVNPDTIVAQFGADTLRLYEMFMGPFEQAISWSESSLVGPRRFLERVWKLAGKIADGQSSVPDDAERERHSTIKKVSEDIEALAFNTAIAALMMYANTLEKRETITRVEYTTLLTLLAPFAPHITEELWSLLSEQGSIHEVVWPSYDNTKLAKQLYNMAVQVNGKVRATFEISASATEEEVKSAALELPDVQKWLNGAIPKKVIVVLGRIVNIVV